MAKCAIWGTVASDAPQARDGNELDSPRAGGRYFVTGSAGRMLIEVDDELRAKLTSYLVDQRRLGVSSPEVDTDTIEYVTALRRRSVSERADRLLRYLSTHTEILGEHIPLNLSGDSLTYEALAWTESTDVREIDFLVKHLAETGLCSDKSSGDFHRVLISVEGYERLRELDDRAPLQSQAFVAMWFDDSMAPALKEGIEKGISDAGYLPLRIDKKQHNNRIDDEMIAEIRRSRFLVADFTHGEDGARGGVYYEAGFAHGLGMQVIFTVREDRLKTVHFDTRQYPHIVWKTAVDLREQLALRISATLGDGPGKRAR